MKNSHKEEEEEYSYYAITIEQLKLLKDNSKKNSFLCDYTDELDGKLITPSLYIGFPRGIIHQKKALKEKIKELENLQYKNNTLSNSQSAEKSKKSQTSIVEKKTKTEKKQKKSDCSNDEATTLLDILAKTKTKSKKQKESSDECSPRPSKPKTSSSEKSSNSKKQFKKTTLNNGFMEDGTSPDDPQYTFSKILNQSLIKDNSASDSDEEVGIDMEARHISDEMPQDFDKKKEKGLALKFKLSKEARFYLTHQRNKDIRSSIGKYVKNQNLNYKIADKAFMLEAENTEKSMKNLRKVYEILKKILKKELIFKTYDLPTFDFHAYKKIFHTGDLKKYYEAVSFLRFTQESNEKVTTLISVFAQNESKSNEMLRFLKERDTKKIAIMKIKYHMYEKGIKRIGMKSRKDFDVILDEGKLVAKYFKKKREVIRSEMEKEKYFDRLSCKMTVFQSSKKDREYNDSIIFHWKRQLYYDSKEDAQNLVRYFGKLKQEFYFRYRFCALVFKQVESQYFPEIKDIDNEFLWSSMKKIEGKSLRINFFGDPGEISDFLAKSEMKKELKKTKKYSKKMKLLLKIMGYDTNPDFFNFKKDFPTTIQKIKPYKEEKTCLHLKIVFKATEDYEEIAQTIKKILEKGFPKNDNKFSSNRGHNKESSEKKFSLNNNKSSEDEKKISKNEGKKVGKKFSEEVKSKDFRVSDDNESEEEVITKKI